MAFNNNPGKQSFTATGGQTGFDFNFKIYADVDLKVYLTPEGQDPDDTTDILILTTDYTVVIDGDNGGTVTLTSGATLNDTIVIARDLDATRDISYVTNGDLKAATLNLDQDYQTYLIIDGFVALASSIQLPQSAVNVSSLLPNVVGDAYLKWNAAGTQLENDTTIPQAVIDAVDSVLNANSWANEAEDTPVKVYINGVPTDRVPTVYSAKHYQAKAEGFKDGAELEKWDAEAKALTALSYANEAEDTPVNVVTSDGDGTFTYTPQAGVFSSLHYAAKAATFNPDSYITKVSSTDNALVRFDGANGAVQSSTTTIDDVGSMVINGGGDVLTLQKGSNIPSLKFKGASNGALLEGGDDYLKTYMNNVLVSQLLSNGDLQFNSGYGSVATAYGCRAWVNFNGTGIVAIRASGNVSSITDNDIGDYTTNLITAMPDANYEISGSANKLTGSTDSNISGSGTAQTASNFRVTTRNSTGTREDPDYVMLSIRR